MSKFKLFLLITLLSNLSILADDITLEKLENLRKTNSISQEDYEFLKSELKGELNEEHHFSLFVNRRLISNNFPIIYRDNDTFISIKDYFKSINFRNYTFQDGILEMYLGRRLQRVVINFNKNTISGTEKTMFFNRGYFIHNEKYFLRMQLFRDIFLSGVDIDYSKGRISMSSKYTLPNEIRRLLKETDKELEAQSKYSKIYYTNSRELFNLGYLRINLDKTFTKTQGIKDDDWDGLLEYQGPLLYGEFTTEYDLKDGDFSSASLLYENLPQNHFLEFRGYKKENNYWEKSILFEKDKGYFEDGKKFIIRENVPIGSRVELVYLGATIDVSYDQNGVVTFTNSEIKDDREYMLRIHTREGKILTRIIKTSDDFNQQNKGEFQYRLYATEVNDLGEKQEDKKQLETEVFYGFTDYLTLGIKYLKTPEYIDEKYQYVERGGGELVYSNHIKTYPYTFILGGEKIFNPDAFEKDSTFEGLFQIKLDKIKLKYEEGYYSDYYDSKESRGISFEYNPWDFLRVDYSYEWLKDWNEEEDNGYELDIELTKNFGRFLTTFSFERNLADEKRYSSNLYYTGYKDYSVRWNNSISEKGDDFESTFSIYNRAMQNGFDYTFEVAYNEKDKEKFTFRVSLDYNNWFNFNMNAKDSGHYDISTGIDRIIDLKNIKKPLDSMDTSRVEVQTFLDVNGNNKYETDEPFIGDVEVFINDEKQVTSSEKATYFYGVPNDILYNLEPKVRRPGYDILNSKFSLKGKSGGDIKAYIPIQPLFSISGQMSLSQKGEEKLQVLDGMVVKIRDNKGVILISMLLDQYGYYDISGLITGTYTLEITSFKNLKLKPLKKKIKLKYDQKIGNTLIINSEIKNNQIVEKE
ncbi:hypothetical protein [uncultured Cetobacterium sp.]|uniref:hypothetical protein n=1 Tax=uncultured Cetobacterium sp. TaxID=527638 RepID=UPI0026313DAF|nr:hypothetical protein [uncultured Cetobacterium sp.]